MCHNPYCCQHRVLDGWRAEPPSNQKCLPHSLVSAFPFALCLRKNFNRPTEAFAGAFAILRGRRS